MPLRCSSAGVWIAPAHTKTCSASDRAGRSIVPSGRGARSSRPRSGRRSRRVSVTPAVGDDLRRPPRSRCGSSVRAIVCFTPRPLLLVAEHARELDRSPAELRRAAFEHGRRRRRRAREARDGQLVLDAVRVAVERSGANSSISYVALPLLGELGGQSVVQPAVDLGAAADAAALGVGDRRAGRARRTSRRGGTSRPSPRARTAPSRRDRPTGPLRRRSRCGRPAASVAAVTAPPAPEPMTRTSVSRSVITRAPGAENLDPPHLVGERDGRRPGSGVFPIGRVRPPS